MTPVPPGGVPAAMLGDSQLSVQEKTSLIFAKLDGPYVGVESFKACFASAGFNLSEATIEDMFVKIQRFGDNLPEGLTFTDIQRVITVYPTLFNVMAFRMQDLDMDYRQIAVIDREGVILDELEETLKQLEGCTLEERGKIRALEAEQHELDEQLRAVSNDAKEKRRDLITQHEGTKAAKRELERSLETETAAKQVQALRDEELGLPQLRSTIDVKRAVLSAKQDSCKAINDSIADLEKKIQELKSDLFTATNDELAAINDVTDAEMQLDEQKQKCVDTDEHVRKAENTVQEKQQDLDECQRIEQETADKLKRLIDSEVLRAAEKETINVKLAGDIINIKQKEDETDTARQAYNDQVSRLNDMKTANENFRSLRAKQYAEEEVVIVQEIRLREQRESLELKEALLRNEVDRIVPHAHSPPNTPHRFHTPGSIPPTLPYAASPPGHSPAKPTPLPNRAELRDRMTDHAGRTQASSHHDMNYVREPRVVQSISPIRHGTDVARFREISPLKVARVQTVSKAVMTPAPLRNETGKTLLEKAEDVAKLQDRLGTLLNMQREPQASPDLKFAIQAVEENLVKAARECEEAVSPRKTPQLMSPLLVNIPPAVPLPPVSALLQVVEGTTRSRPLSVSLLPGTDGLEECLVIRSKKDSRMAFIVAKPVLQRNTLEHIDVERALQAADGSKAAGVVLILPKDAFISGKAIDAVATTATLSCMKK